MRGNSSNSLSVIISRRIARRLKFYSFLPFRSRPPLALSARRVQRAFRGWQLLRFGHSLGPDRLIPDPAHMARSTSRPRYIRHAKPRCAHLGHVRFYKLDMRVFAMAVKRSFFRTPGTAGPGRGEAPPCVHRLCAGRGGKSFRLWPYHRVALVAPQRAIHARRPHLLWRRLHIPNLQLARGAGQRRDPDEGSERPLRARGTKRERISSYEPPMNSERRCDNLAVYD